MHACFVVFVLVFQYLAKRLAGKNVLKMTCKTLTESQNDLYCVGVGRKTLTQSHIY